MTNCDAGNSAGSRFFASEKDGRNHLYSIAAAGGAPQLLTPGDFDVEDVALSVDKRSILYTSNQNDVDRRHIWRVSATGGEPEALTRGETIEWSPVEPQFEKKYYASGIGEVKEQVTQGGHERFELVSLTHG